METPVDKRRILIGIALVLILTAILLRLAPHPPNFAPIAAVAIFGGALLSRRLGLIVPLAAIVATDFIIGTHDLILVTWGSYALIALASSLWLRRKLSFMRGAALTLSASVFFFVTTNFAVWLTSGMYERSWAGLSQCFTLALPFFRNTLASDLIYTAALFGVYALATKASLYLAETRASSSKQI